MIISAGLCRLDGKGAYRIWRRDKRNHASPNAGQTEAACAGALGIKLCGPAYYFGELVDKPYIGDSLRPVEPEDIVRANKLMYASAILMLLISLLIRGGMYAAL
jgi:adenosylcobinamide-phosphate synthase